MKKLTMAMMVLFCLPVFAYADVATQSAEMKHIVDIRAANFALQQKTEALEVSLDKVNDKIEKMNLAMSEMNKTIVAQANTILQLSKQIHSKITKSDKR